MPSIRFILRPCIAVPLLRYPVVVPTLHGVLYSLLPSKGELQLGLGGQCPALNPKP